MLTYKNVNLRHRLIRWCVPYMVIMLCFSLPFFTPEYNSKILE